MTKEGDLQLGMKCVKYMLFVANFMFMLVGFLLISIGYTLKTIYTEFDSFLFSYSYKASDLAVAVGILILVVALFGCVGAYRESVCLVNLYALCLLVIVILEVALSITAYESRKSIQQALKDDMFTSMLYFDSTTNYIWTATQNTLHCCGVDGPWDWDSYKDRFNFTRRICLDNIYLGCYAVPNSCSLRSYCIQTTDNLCIDGCLPKINYILQQSSLLLGIGAMCITFIQFLGAFFAHLLARSIRKLKTQMEVENTIRRQKLYEQMAMSRPEGKVSPVLYIPSSSEA